MASKTSGTVLYSPDGRAWETSSAEEVVNLKARGYSDTKPKSSASSSSTASKS